jgi:hypothetical protein
VLGDRQHLAHAAVQTDKHLHLINVNAWLLFVAALSPVGQTRNEWVEAACLPAACSYAVAVAAAAFPWLDACKRLKAKFQTTSVRCRCHGLTSKSFLSVYMDTLRALICQYVWHLSQ